MSVVPLYIMYMATVLCEDRVLDGPASGEKGSKGGPHVLSSSHVNEVSQIGSSAMAPMASTASVEVDSLEVDSR